MSKNKKSKNFGPIEEGMIDNDGLDRHKKK